MDLSVQRIAARASPRAQVHGTGKKIRRDRAEAAARQEGSRSQPMRWKIQGRKNGRGPKEGLVSTIRASFAMLR